MCWIPRLLVLVALAGLVACGGERAPSARKDAPAEAHERLPFARLAVIDAGPLAGMHFEHYGVNPTIETVEDPRSSFGLAADTASFSVAAAHLDRGGLPPVAAVRIEDFVNAAPATVAGPIDGAPFRVHAEAFPSPNRPGYHVLRLALRARTAPPQPVRLVAVVDVAAVHGHLELARETLRQVFAGLGPADEVAIVGADGRVLLRPTSPRAEGIDAALRTLRARRPAGPAGLDAAYDLAARAQAGRVRRVLYCGDGLTDREARGFAAMARSARAGAALGVALTAVGVGIGRYDDDRMARLAQAGAGRYLYVDHASTTRRMARPELVGARAVVARDARAQVRFDPRSVQRYRLLGHERHGDRRADRVTAAGVDVVADQVTTILYEIKLVAGVEALGAVEVRYRPAGGGAVAVFSHALGRAAVGADYAAASGEARLALVAAAFGEKLRGAWWVRGVGYPDLKAQWVGLPEVQRADPRAKRLAWLIDRAAALDARGDPHAERAPLAEMTFDHVPIVR